MQSVVIFGAPGAGKSTQVQLIRKLMAPDVSVRVAHEPTESEAARALIADLYARRPAAAFKLQALVLAERVRQYESDIAAGEIVLADGHPLTDLAMYVRSAIEDGAFTPSETYCYLAEFAAHAGRVPAAFKPPTCVVFLRIAPEEAARRVAARNSSAERDVDAAVFQALARRAEAVAHELCKQGVAVIEVDGHGNKDAVARRVVERLDLLFRRTRGESPFAQ